MASAIERDAEDGMLQGFADTRTRRLPPHFAGGDKAAVGTGADRSGVRDGALRSARTGQPTSERLRDTAVGGGPGLHVLPATSGSFDEQVALYARGATR